MYQDVVLDNCAIEVMRNVCSVEIKCIIYFYHYHEVEIEIVHDNVITSKTTKV